MLNVRNRKSTLIDAACVALGSLFQSMENGKTFPITTDDARLSFAEQGDMADVQSQFPVSVSANGIICNEAINWSRTLNSAKARMTKTDAANIIKTGESLQKRVSNGSSDTILPILARYGTDRLWKQSSAKLPDTLPNRTQGYVDALHAASNESRMNVWFMQQSIWEWQNKSESALFTAVKKALAPCFDATALVDKTSTLA